MINYWPRRASVRGFTQSISSKVKERLSNDPFKGKPKIEQPSITIHRPRVGVGHWANRGFEEYKDRAA